MRKKIIYADDHIDDLGLMEEIAKLFHFEVTTVTSSNEVLDYLILNPDDYGLVILDLNMGVWETGDSARKRIQELDPTIPVVIYSAYDKSIVGKDVMFWGKLEYDIQEIGKKIVEILDSQE